MDCPNEGLTIFQGAESIKLDYSLQRPEEVEEIEDQRRRNDELAKQLDHAFDDLTDDEVNDSFNQQSHLSESGSNLIFENGFNKNNNFFARGDPPPFSAIHKQDHNFEHLKKLLESKTREFEHVTRLLNDESKKSENKINELAKKLSLAEAEKERSEMTRKQTHELLVESKTKMAGLDDIVSKLKSKIANLEDENYKLVAELENKKTMLSDALHKYQMVEENAGLKADKHTDALLKQAASRYTAEIAMMQQQIDNLKEKLDTKTKECRTLETRYHELQRSREQLMIDKTDTINHLTQNLEDSQKQYQNLVAKSINNSSIATDNLKLKATVNSLEQQTHDMQRTINNLTQKLETTNNELELMETVIGDSKHRESDFSVTRHNLVGSTPLNPNAKNTDERFARLKNELFVSMNGLKDKREEIKKLEREIASKNVEIKKLKDDENHALVEVNQYKDEVFRLSSKLKILESELKRMSGSRPSDHQEELEDKIFTLTTQNDELNDKYGALDLQYEKLNSKYNQIKQDAVKLDSLHLELEKQKFLLNDAQKECDRIKNLYIEMSGNKDDISRELSELKSRDVVRELSVERDKVSSLERALKLAELKASELSKLLDKEKLEHEHLMKDIREKCETDYKSAAKHSKSFKNSSNTCTKCIDHLAEISKYEIQNLQLQNSCSTYSKELNDLTAELNHARTTIDSLHEKLDLKAERDQLINELKHKAVQFEEYMRTQSNLSAKDVSTSPQKIESRDQSVSTSPDLDEMMDSAARKLARDNEHKIREEMARLFANEVKNIEEKFKIQFQKFENNIILLKEELNDKSQELSLRTHEVDVLKYVISTERAKMTEIMSKKDEDAKSLFDKQNEVMKKCRNELEMMQRKVHFLQIELQEKQESIESERQSMEKLIRQFSDERKRFQERELEVIEKFKELEVENSKNLEVMTEKYKSSKKTALNYKIYAEEKEKHMEKEYERIKEGYTSALHKYQNRMRDVLENQEKSVKERIAKVEEQYEARIKSMKNLLVETNNLVC